MSVHQPNNRECRYDPMWHFGDGRSAEPCTCPQPDTQEGEKCGGYCIVDGEGHYCKGVHTHSPADTEKEWHEASREENCSGGQLVGDAPHIGCICSPADTEGWEKCAYLKCHNTVSANSITTEIGMFCSEECRQQVTKNIGLALLGTPSLPHHEKGGEWEEEFDKHCEVNIYGECKYWKPETFGYAPHDMEASMDKFFPEQIKKLIRSLIKSAEGRLKLKIKDMICEKCNNLVK